MTNPSALSSAMRTTSSEIIRRAWPRLLCCVVRHSESTGDYCGSCRIGRLPAAARVATSVLAAGAQDARAFDQQRTHAPQEGRENPVGPGSSEPGPTCAGQFVAPITCVLHAVGPSGAEGI